MRSTRERHLRLVLGAATWAAIFSVWVVFFGVDEIDLDAVTPWPKVSGVNRDGRGWATLIVSAFRSSPRSRCDFETNRRFVLRRYLSHSSSVLSSSACCESGCFTSPVHSCSD